jgi:hypothetical protein
MPPQPEQMSIRILRRRPLTPVGLGVLLGLGDQMWCETTATEDAAICS